MKKYILALFALTFMTSKQALAENPDMFVVAFSIGNATISQVTQELLDAGFEVVNSVDKHPNGKPRRIQWVEVRVKSQSEINYLYETYLKRQGVWKVERLDVWSQPIPDPTFFKPINSDVNLSSVCQKLFA